MTFVRAGLFLGGIMSFPYLRELGITHILVTWTRSTPCDALPAFSA